MFKLKHPADKFAQLQFALLGVAIIFGIVTLLKGATIYILLMFYSLSLSMVFDGMAQHHKRQNNMYALQFLRAIIMLIFITILYF